MSATTDLTALMLIKFKTLDTLRTDLGSETFIQLLGLFEVELVQMQQRFLESMNSQDHKDILDATHILKNTAALYGAQRLAFCANRLHSTKIGDDYLCQTQELIEVIELSLVTYQDYIGTLTE
jgi:HPt (histidine-containing phosphotransfer) domain-containing protein